MFYTLMRKDTALMQIDISESGDIIRIGKKNAGIDELLPFQNRRDAKGIITWWNNRAVPIQQGSVQKILQEKGLISPKQFLIKNLGLSLTDYYWLCPMGISLNWGDVSLFSNNFDGSLSFENEIKEDEFMRYSPNSSLQGQLEKSWIIVDGRRMLLKGNRDNLSSECMNEVIASELHRKQGFKNYTSYVLQEMPHKSYDYACLCESFTSEKHELLSAYDVVTSEKQPNNCSSYEYFIALCKKYGLKETELRRDLEYQIMTDFVLSNLDRHLSNISIIRDANTLQFLKMAPIYDTGMAFLVGKPIPAKEKELLELQTTSFASAELKLLSYVQDRTLVDCNKLPSAKWIKDFYSQDSQIEESKIDKITQLYERKIDLLDKFQHGLNLSKYRSLFH